MIDMEQQKSRTLTNDLLKILRDHRAVIGIYILAIIGIGILFPLVLCKPFNQNFRSCMENLYFLAGWFYAWVGFLTLFVIGVTALLALQQLKASSYFQIYSRTDTALSLLLNDKVKLERLFYDDHKLKDLNEEAFHFADSTRLAVNMLFTLFENIYYQYEKFHVLEDEDWNSWKLSIKWLFSIPYVRECWQRKEAGSYTLEFVEEIKSLTGIQMASKVSTTIPSKLNDKQNP